MANLTDLLKRANAPTELTKRPAENPRHKLVVTIISFIIAVGIVYFFIPSPALIFSDLMRNWTTTPSPSIEQLVMNLRLTSRGKFIFGAVDPQLEEKTVFNSACPAAEEDASSLGCYDPNTQKIHIYNVESEELAGEIEATAAHELLHAAWERLSVFERMQIEPLLYEVYNSAEHHDQLAKSTQNYRSEDLSTELHSQIAERIKDLPPALENYYAKYFEDQNLIASYFEKYSSVFDKIMDGASNLLTEIEAGRQALEQKANEYTAWLEDYNTRVQNFNSCARDPECSLVNFESRRDELISEGRRIDAAADAYEADRTALNAKIDEYNSNVEHLRKLDYALDSRSSPGASIETKESNN